MDAHTEHGMTYTTLECGCSERSSDKWYEAFKKLEGTGAWCNNHGITKVKRVEKK